MILTDDQCVKPMFSSHCRPGVFAGQKYIKETLPLPQFSCHRNNKGDIDRCLLTTPSGKLSLECKKIPKNFFFSKKLPKIYNGNFFEKIEIFGNIFKRKRSSFWAIFGHSNGNFPEGQLVTADIY